MLPNVKRQIVKGGEWIYWKTWEGKLRQELLEKGELELIIKPNDLYSEIVTVMPKIGSQMVIFAPKAVDKEGLKALGIDTEKVPGHIFIAMYTEEGYISLNTSHFKYSLGEVKNLDTTKLLDIPVDYISSKKWSCYSDNTAVIDGKCVYRVNAVPRPYPWWAILSVCVCGIWMIVETVMLIKHCRDLDNGKLCDCCCDYCRKQCTDVLQIISAIIIGVGLGLLGGAWQKNKF